jgi:hypothetical protein
VPGAFVSFDVFVGQVIGMNPNAIQSREQRAVFEGFVGSECVVPALPDHRMNRKWVVIERP